MGAVQKNQTTSNTIPTTKKELCDWSKLDYKGNRSEELGSQNYKLILIESITSMALIKSK